MFCRCYGGNFLFVGGSLGIWVAFLGSDSPRILLRLVAEKFEEKKKEEDKGNEMKDFACLMWGHIGVVF